MQLLELNMMDTPRPAITRTGKVSMAKRGMKVHTCFCGKVRAPIDLPKRAYSIAEGTWQRSYEPRVIQRRHQLSTLAMRRDVDITSS